MAEDVQDEQASSQSPTAPPLRVEHELASRASFDHGDLACGIGVFPATGQRLDSLDCDRKGWERSIGRCVVPSELHPVRVTDSKQSPHDSRRAVEHDSSRTIEQAVEPAFDGAAPEVVWV